MARIYKQSCLYKCMGSPGKKIHCGARDSSIWRSKSLGHLNKRNTQPSINLPSLAQACTKSRFDYNRRSTWCPSMKLIVGLSSNPQDLIIWCRIFSIKGRIRANFKTRAKWKSSATFDISKSVKMKLGFPLMLTGYLIGILKENRSYFTIACAYASLTRTPPSEAPMDVEDTKGAGSPPWVRPRTRNQRFLIWQVRESQSEFFFFVFWYIPN